MTDDFTSIDEQYICDECGYTSPVANERCPDCGSPMSSLGDDKAKTKVKAVSDDDDLVDDSNTVGETSSLEALQNEEQEESDKEYQNDTYGNE